MHIETKRNTKPNPSQWATLHARAGTPHDRQQPETTQSNKAHAKYAVCIQAHSALLLLVLFPVLVLALVVDVLQKLLVRFL